MTTLAEALDQALQHHQAGRLAEAESLYRQILAVAPRHDEALYFLGRLELDRGQFEQAAQWIGQAILVDGNNAIYHHNLGKAFEAQRKYQPAIAAYREALRLQPDYALAHNSLAGALSATGALAEAESAYRKALHCQPDLVGAYNNLGMLLRDQHRLAEARECYQAALRLHPRLVEARNNLGNILRQEGELAAAIDAYEQALQCDADYAPAHFNLAIALKQSGRTGEALASFAKVIELEPGNADAFARLVWTRQQICDWQTYDADLERLWTDAERLLSANRPTGVGPFQALTLPWSRSRLRAVAGSHSAAAARERATGLSASSALSHPISPDRLRIGYLSGDFYDHPIGHLLQGFFGRHQRDQFEVFAYSFGPADGSGYRQRIVAECEHFIEVRGLSNRALAQRIRDDGIQILVDLMGYTGLHRVDALAQRPAPIQISFLGMLGTMGAQFIDYLITDGIVTPPEFAPDFTERFVKMPHSYLIAEPETAIPQAKLRRADHGLVDGDFVYCSFNSSYKIEPRTFAVWMRILTQVPRSVLWLYSNDPLCENNLHREAAARGVAPERLVFGDFLSRPQHLLRHQLADLFLDTLLYNAAGTATLALQMGLPVLACRGETFASRVGASLLTTSGLTELIATDIEHYERLAVELGRAPQLLEPLRAKLASARANSPLFGTRRFVGNLEAAYRAVWQRFATGQPTQSLEVTEKL